MKAIFVSELTILAALSVSIFAPARVLASEACDIHVVESPTKFPIRSQLRGHEGTVYMNVTVDENGRAYSVKLRRSSGHRLLDRAAKNSVKENWRFDVSGCERKDLPADHLIAVEYRSREY